MRGRASLSIANCAASRGTTRRLPATMSPTITKNVVSTANPRDLRGMMRERPRTGAESTVASAKPPTTMMRAEGTRHATNTSAAKTTKTAATISTLRRRLGTQMGVGQVLLLWIVEAPLPSPTFSFSDMSGIVAFLSSEDDTTNLLTLARAPRYTVYSEARLIASLRCTIFGGYSPECVDGGFSGVHISSIVRISPPIATPGLQPLRPTITIVYIVTIHTVTPRARRRAR